MCSLLMAEQGNAAKTTRLLQRAKSGCGWSRVSPQRGFMVGSGFWTGPSEHGRGGETGSVHTADTKLLLIPEVFVGWQTHLILTAMTKSQYKIFHVSWMHQIRIWTICEARSNDLTGFSMGPPWIYLESTDLVNSRQIHFQSVDHFMIY